MEEDRDELVHVDPQPLRFLGLLVNSQGLGNETV